MTGILTDTGAVARLLHTHGALSFWDYAAAGPYVPIRVSESRPGAGDHKDAVFLSPHKFPGGPQTPGVLVVRRDLVHNPVPTALGGRTVMFVDPIGHRYLGNPVARKEGGTPAIVESIRAGLDSLIEIGASTVVLWELSGTGEDRQRRALRLIGGAFVALAAYLTVQSAVVLAVGYHPRPSGLGIAWTALTAAAMLSLAAGKARTGRALDNPVLTTEGRVTLVNGILAVAVLAGLVLNAAAGLVGGPGGCPGDRVLRAAPNPGDPPGRTAGSWQRAGAGTGAMKAGVTLVKAMLPVAPWWHRTATFGGPPRRAARWRAQGARAAADPQVVAVWPRGDGAAERDRPPATRNCPEG